MIPEGSRGGHVAPQSLASFVPASCHSFLAQLGILLMDHKEVVRLSNCCHGYQYRHEKDGVGQWLDDLKGRRVTVGCSPVPSARCLPRAWTSADSDHNLI